MIKLIGGLLMAVGILIAGASGLCSLFFLISMSMSSASDGGLILVLGGIPFAVGIGLFLLGRKILRSDRNDAPPPPPS